jgi:hypothetical protein
MAFGIRVSATAIDCAAAAAFAAAVAFAAFVTMTTGLAALLGPLAFALAYAGLKRADGERPHRVAEFELEGFDWPPCSAAAMSEDDNVVCLFGPGQLAMARSAEGSAKGDAGDAGTALSDALAELRRSLR